MAIVVGVSTQRMGAVLRLSSADFGGIYASEVVRRGIMKAIDIDRLHPINIGLVGFITPLRRRLSYK